MNADRALKKVPLHQNSPPTAASHAGRRVGQVAALTLSLVGAAWLPADAAAKDGGGDDRGDRRYDGHSCQGDDHFVKRAGSKLRLHGRDFRFAGTNNYYLIYKSPFMVDDVLNAADAEGLSAIRTWGGIDIGNQDGSSSISGKAEGVYFHYMNGAAPAFNDGADGLRRLDYAIYKAGKLGLKMVIPFVNNWREFGGMDQYVSWRGGQYHDQFYTDATIRSWFKAWISHLLNRVNSYTGVRYRDDATIMAWELANEPRCGGSGDYPRSSTCDSRTLVNWANEMSRYVHSVDSKHLISVGDEGFYCEPGASDWIDTCGDGVDTVALASLPQVDVGRRSTFTRTSGARTWRGARTGSTGTSPTRSRSTSRRSSASSACRTTRRATATTRPGPTPHSRLAARA